MDRDKRELRQTKREVKRAGSKRRRRYLKRELRDDPEDAAHTEFRFGRDSSVPYNGLDQDSTRERTNQSPDPDEDSDCSLPEV